MGPRSLRDRYVFLITLSILFVCLTTYNFRLNISDASTSVLGVTQDNTVGQSMPTTTETYPKYKPIPPAKSLPIVDNFPLALNAHSAAELPPIASWNRPPSPHVPEITPLFIGFTRNWRLLQQVVVSYMTAGWPPEDIYVVENTGVMDSNQQGRLSLQNPFFLNHTRLHMLGVNVLVTPTLLTFAQLQSYYIFHSISQNWTTYFWSHMDVVALSFEDQYNAAHRNANPPIPILPPSDPKHDYSNYESVYKKCLNALRNVLNPDPETGEMSRWAMRFFSYDRLALVNVAAFVEVGGWDTLIPFYATDCDMHARLEMAKFNIVEVPAGLIFDVASSLEDLIVLYRKAGPETPDASFRDPNKIEEELKAKAESEATESAGLGEKGRRDQEDKNSDKKGEAAWEKFIGGQTPPGAAGEVETQHTSTSSSSVVPTPIRKTTSKWEEDTIFSPAFQKITAVLDRMSGSKHENARGRNTWQSRQIGGQGEPFYRDSEGFEIGLAMTIENGKAVFREKWGHRDCDIVAMKLKPSDAWRVEHDWE